jgi:hypothetical protein
VLGQAAREELIRADAADRRMPIDPNPRIRPLALTHPERALLEPLVSVDHRDKAPRGKVVITVA